MALLVFQVGVGSASAQEPAGVPAPIDPDGVDDTSSEPVTASAEPAERYEAPVLSLRLSEDLAPEQRAAVEEVIDTLPNVVVGPQATHAIAPHPSLGELLVLHEIQGADPVKRYALDTQLERDGEMPLDAVYEFYASELASEYPWASNVPLPIELGDIEQSRFADHLRERLMVMARRAALVRLAGGGPSSGTSVCVSNALPPAGYCPLPGWGKRWNEVSDREPIYISVESDLASARFVTVVAINRDGDVAHVMTGEAARYLVEAPQVIGETLPDQAAAVSRWIFAPEATLNEALPPGHHDLLILTTDRPIAPALWEQSLSGTVSGEVCSPQFEFGICRAMQGKTGWWAAEQGQSAALHSVGVSGFVPRTRRIVSGSPASLEVSRWQAQLLRYRKIELDTRAPSGRQRFSFKQSHKCGGAYIGGGFVLTAAHCIPDDVSEMRIRLGSRNISHGGKTFKIRSLVEHRRGNARARRVDLALIQLKATAAELRAVGSNLRAVPLATNRNPRFAKASGLTVTGWGFQKARLPGQTGWLSADGTRQTQPDRLSQLVLDQADMAECRARSEYSAYLPRDILCLRGAIRGGDSCSGDSGGPVTSRAAGGRRLVGIVSSGIGCAFEDLPAVYVSVAQHTGWIERAKQKMRSSRAGFYELE
ncbi:MAG: serine protease [Pseudomonadota bacterium]